MKHLKLFEGWSDEYLFDFTDDGKFDIKEDGKKVVGEYRGEFDTATMTNQFADSVFKMSSNYKILKAQSFFNQVTGNAKFEIEVQDYDGEFIEIDTPSGKLKWIPEKIVNLWSPCGRDQDPQEAVCNYIYIEGRLENGTKKTLLINFDSKNTLATRSLDNIKMILTLGTKSRGLSLGKENISKLIRLISENKITNRFLDDRQFDEQLEICIRTLNLFA
jgi:hypothetical protein